jgi:hypothetical protein
VIVHEHQNSNSKKLTWNTLWALADALSGYLKEFEVSVRQVDFHDYGATTEMIASQDHELFL